MTGTRDRLIRLFRFGSGAAVSFGGTVAITFVATEWLQLRERISFAVAVIVMFFVNFAYLRYVVFRAGGRPWPSQMKDFFVASIGFRVAEYLAFLVLLDVFHLHYLLSVTSVLVVSFLIKFQVFDRHTFRARY